MKRNPDIHLGFPIELDYKKTCELFNSIYPDPIHLAICSYWNNGLIHIQCKCGDAHDLKLPGREDECYCGNSKEYSGKRCFGCPDN
jgi:hypothetical protein